MLHLQASSLAPLVPMSSRRFALCATQCCYESALIGSKSAVTLSRLAKQCAALYVEAEELARAGQLAKHLDKTWGLHLQAKAG